MKNGKHRDIWESGNRELPVENQRSKNQSTCLVLFILHSSFFILNSSFFILSCSLSLLDDVVHGEEDGCWEDVERFMVTLDGTEDTLEVATDGAGELINEKASAGTKG